MNGNTESDNRQPLSITETAELLGYSRPTIRRMVEAEQLRRVRIGRRWKITRTSIEEFVARREDRTRWLSGKTGQGYVNSIEPGLIGRDHISVKEAAELLGMSYCLVNKLVYTGEWPSIMVTKKHKRITKDFLISKFGTSVEELFGGNENATSDSKEVA